MTDEGKDLTIPEEKLPAEMITDTSNIMAVLDGALPPVQATEIMEEMVPSYDTTPFVILVQAQSPYTLPPHRIPAGSFILRKSKNEFVALGENIDVLVIDWRPKAMRVDKATNRIEVEFDRESEKFLEIQEAAKAKAQGNFWGFEFLIYLGDYGEFAHLYCNNPTLQNVARSELIHYMRKTATLKTVLLQKKDTNFQWFAFNCSDCSAPFQVPLDLEALKEKHSAFKNPSSFVGETKPTSESSNGDSADTRER